MKKLIALMLTVLMLLTFAGCDTSVLDAKEALFTKAGMEITLTEGFKETEMAGYTVCYDSSEVAVFVLKEEFSAAEGFGDYTLEEYAALVYQANADRSPDAVTTTDGLTTMEYVFENEEDGNTYKYFSTMFKGPDAFWLIQFSCFEENYDEYKPHFIEWAKSAKFTEA